MKTKLTALKKSLNNIKNNQIPILSQSLWNIDSLAIDIFFKKSCKQRKSYLCRSY